MRQFLADYSTIAFRLLFSPQPNRNQTYRNQRILLDGGKWEGCEFVDCRLVYYGAAGLTMRDCDIVRENPRHPDYPVEFRGGALNGFCLLNTLAESSDDKRGMIERTFHLPPIEAAQHTTPSSPRLVKDEGDAA